jgi:Ca2+-binding EF-hand superfamily protein
MRPMHVHAALIACLGVALSAVSAAQGADPAGQAIFDSLDKNKDDRVSINEATEHDALFVAFKNLDKDRDGLLTRSEFAGFKGDKPRA